MMRASVFLVSLLFLLVMSRPAPAAPAQTQTVASISAAQLAKAAAVEAQRLQQSADNARPALVVSKSQTSNRRQAAGPDRKLTRSQPLSAKLVEAERRRIRDRYREMQRLRISARLLARQDSSSNDAKQPAAVDTAD